ncbi:hypothetical protein M406DRAFT_11270, partial [Cryphonectria parasitica EP155]
LAAAQAMLDKTHESPCSRPNDSNTYTFGNIGMHNIIIACLPSGQYGTTNAATVANNMLRSFPSIRMGFMVGIGGGVPGKADVRLGDIVVGDRVIQYDFGKTVRDGVFERTSTPYKPPHELMTAVSNLRARHERQLSEIPALLSDMLQRNPAMTQYSRHGELEDFLFDSAYDHQESTDDCEHCDRAKLLLRSPRKNNNPEIHYGVIASGNQVMKHGKTRDKAAQVLGILCFEMEAAGLTDHFPCLVIRGICDYSDSHKSKQWQRYAAATAAAYTKELLHVIPAIETAKHVITPATEHREFLLGSLRFDQLDSRYSNIKAAYYKTCEWLLRHPDYTDWLDPAKFDSHRGFLWINGKPGSGKSTLMKYAFAKAKWNAFDDAAVISFFFNARGDTLEKTVVGMYRSILLQLLEKLPDLQEVLDDLCLTAVSLNESFVWNAEVLQNLFSSAIARLNQRRLTCFVDALDECDEEQVRVMVEFFEALGDGASENGSKLYICFSSRHYPYIAIQHGRKLVLEDQLGHGQDLEKYVRGRLRAGTGRLLAEIRDEVLQKAAGVFMWTVLVVDILNKEFERGRIFAVKKRLQEIPDQLSELFKDILRRDSDNMAELLLCIQWILYAKQPLRREEFYFAVVSGICPESLAEWDPEYQNADSMDRFVLSSSKGLAEVTKSKHRTVQFIHESVRDFLIKDHGFHDLWRELGEDIQSSSHDRLKQCCQIYLGLDISGYLAKRAMRQLLTEKYPFLEYAALQVFYHANEAAAGLPQGTFLEQFPLGAWINLKNLVEKREIRRYTPTASLLYLLAEGNWIRLLNTQLQHNPILDIEGQRYGYPLFAAFENNHKDANGHESIVSLLLETGKVDVHSRDHIYYTPMFHAIEQGHESIVKLLLETGKVDINRADLLGRTALMHAAEKGYEGIVKLLLETGKVDVNRADSENCTALTCAAEKGYEGIVKLLLETGKVDINRADLWGRTSL